MWADPSFMDTRSTRVALDLGIHETIREEGQTSEGQQPHLGETSCHYARDYVQCE